MSMQPMLPNFVGIGTQKAGTTWLYEILRRHPSISFPGGKEIHYWDFELNKRSIDWYQNHFDSCQPGIRCGELTPAYCAMGVHRIERFHAALPHARLFLIMRNPIERAWSMAMMNLRRIQAKLRTEKRQVVLDVQVSDFSDQFFERQFQLPSSIRRGDYESMLVRWHRFYNKSQLLLVYYDDLVRKPHQFIENICNHIGVEASPLLTNQENLINTRVFGTESPPIRDSLIAPLSAIYLSKIHALESYLDTDLSAWLEPYHIR